MYDIVGRPDQVDMQNMEQLHTHDHHQSVTEHSANSGHRIWQHKMYTYMENTETADS